MTLIFDTLAEEYASRKDTTLVLTDFETIRLLPGENGTSIEIREKAVSLTWKEEDSPWSNFIVTKKRRSPASEMVTYSGAASVPESPLRRQPTTSETKLPETSTSSPPQRSEIVWTGKESLPVSVLGSWFVPLSQAPSLSIHGTTYEGTVTYQELSLSSMSKELSDPELGFETLLESLSKTIGFFFRQHQEIRGLTIFPSSLPTASIVIVRNSNKNTSSTSPTSSSPRSDDTVMLDVLSDSDDKS